MGMPALCAKSLFFAAPSYLIARATGCQRARAPHPVVLSTKWRRRPETFSFLQPTRQHTFIVGNSNLTPYCRPRFLKQSSPLVRPQKGSLAPLKAPWFEEQGAWLTRAKERNAPSAQSKPDRSYACCLRFRNLQAPHPSTTVLSAGCTRILQVRLDNQKLYEDSVRRKRYMFVEVN